MFWALSSESLAATTPDCLELLQLMVAALLRVEGGKGEDVGSGRGRDNGGGNRRKNLNQDNRKRGVSEGDSGGSESDNEDAVEDGHDSNNHRSGTPGSAHKGKGAQCSTQTVHISLSSDLSFINTPNHRFSACAAIHITVSSSSINKWQWIHFSLYLDSSRKMMAESPSSRLHLGRPMVKS